MPGHGVLDIGEGERRRGQGQGGGGISAEENVAVRRLLFGVGWVGGWEGHVVVYVLFSSIGLGWDVYVPAP